MPSTYFQFSFSFLKRSSAPSIEEKLVMLNQFVVNDDESSDKQSHTTSNQYSSQIIRSEGNTLILTEDDKNPVAPDDRSFALLAYMLFMSTVGLHFVGPIDAVLLCLAWSIFGLSCLYFIKRQDRIGQHNSIPTGFARALLMGIFSLGILIFYMGTHRTIHEMKRSLWDKELVHLDNFFLGSFFPHGQFAMWTDNNEWIGPNSMIGRLAVEFLQWMYVSFFFWCSAILVYVGLYDYLLTGLYITPDQNNDDDQMMVDVEAFNSEEKQTRSNVVSSYLKVGCWRRIAFRHKPDVWRKLQMLHCCIIGAFLLNFTISFIFPALSPRVYLAEMYRNQLHGLGFGDQLREMMRESDEGTYGSFPSGHVALTWIPALAAMKLGYVYYGRACTVAAVLITFSTIYLRYHYFVDVICASILVAFGLSYGNLWTPPTSFFCAINPFRVLSSFGLMFLKKPRTCVALVGW
eukprot:TRINITY_DN8554_c0_g1_i1.p1 TRINITY_DN8554_c0_g1~~TRINITY_DN8554_c0_g1_i1.p1  ORF type:complete len:461 (-),score=46.27 TRINITY_DN8554_c0_g1_i1:154-1536(-)